MIGCGGSVPASVLSDDVQSWPIYGAKVKFANFKFIEQQLVVFYVDGSYVIVEGIAAFNVPQNNEATILALIAANANHC